MAQRVRVLLVDDLDGGPAAETVQFGLDGVGHTIDLNQEHAQQLRESLAPWVASARRVRPGTRTATMRTALAASGETRKRELKEIREWARANGHEISDRGRVPAAVEEAWRASR